MHFSPHVACEATKTVRTTYYTRGMESSIFFNHKVITCSDRHGLLITVCTGDLQGVARPRGKPSPHKGRSETPLTDSTHRFSLLRTPRANVYFGAACQALVVCSVESRSCFAYRCLIRVEVFRATQGRCFRPLASFPR